jgi:hypothetical protein
MAHDELAEKMLAFIETRDGDYFDERYASPRDFAATILSDFAEYLGIELVVPDYVPQLNKPEIDRNELFKAMMPELTKLFNIEFQKYNKENNNGNDT